MLRSEAMTGLVRTSPTKYTDTDGRSEDPHKADQQNEPGPTVEELVAALVAKGCAVTSALVGPNIASPLESKAPLRSADAGRKARERQEKLAQGWKQLNVMAPIDPVAREFLAAAALRIKSKKVLNALRAALDNPRVVTIGQRVLRLQGEAGDQVRRALRL